MREQQNECADNQRQYARIAAKYVLYHERYSFNGEKKEVVSGNIRDYSGGGLCFESNIEYKMGDLLKLRVGIPGWERFKTEFYKEDKMFKSKEVVALASVVRVECIEDRRFEIGVDFVAIDGDHRRALIKQIKAFLRL